jgi:hypothetical protein
VKWHICFGVPGRKALRINCVVEVEIRRCGCAKCTCHKMRTRRRAKGLNGNRKQWLFHFIRLPENQAELVAN